MAGKAGSHSLPVSSMRLAPGLRTVVSRFESAVREHDRYLSGGEVFDKDDAKEIDRRLAIHKQALYRKLLRMQNGEEYTDTEALKKDLRTMCRVIRNIQMSPQHAAEILHTATDTLKIVQDVIDHRRRL